jgi:hypothetical protein
MAGAALRFSEWKKRRWSKDEGVSQMEDAVSRSVEKAVRSASRLWKCRATFGKDGSGGRTAPYEMIHRIGQ